MKIRPLLALAAVAASGAAFLAPSTASAWTCPTQFTQPYDVALPNGKTVRACTPYLNCETCFAVTP